jgi:lysophospholipase L1-like esterase
VTIISASIPKYVDGIRGCTTQAFLGATIGRITELLSRGKINISNIDIVIIHVGTNNISSAQNVDTIISYYGDLIHKLKYKTNAHIVCTSILPRLCDHDKTVNKINKVNLELKKLCIRKKIQYTNLYRSFLLNNRPDSSLYAPRDGLHLNFAGTSLLRKKFINIIKHVSVN